MKTNSSRLETVDYAISATLVFSGLVALIAAVGTFH